ncbi:MmpS family transport accessory protein [Mycobacterium sp.]|uniref:MmpS family transport accessory protein n=1 Tax=Mycobacterium sp. TaxID=1785 RepID=UPI003D0FA8DA
MKRFSLTGLLRRGWILLVAVVVVAVAGFGVYRLHGIFGSHPITSAGGGSSNDIVPFNPKRVTYQVFGQPGAVATINYVDVHAAPQQVLGAALPWSLTMTTTDPAVFANVVAQGDANRIGCRIIVDDIVKDEKTVDKPDAYTWCLDKSS